MAESEQQAEHQPLTPVAAWRRGCRTAAGAGPVGGSRDHERVEVSED
jgi:hypothetical protein